MKRTKLGFKAAALLLAVFFTLLALPLAGAMAAGSTIVIRNTVEEYWEGAEENWQLIGNFSIMGSHLPITTAQLVILAWDVDAPRETDRIRVRNTTTNATALVGILTGMDYEDNTTVLDVPASFLTEGDYALELDMGTTDEGVFAYKNTWIVEIKSATLILNGGLSTFSASVSFTASGTTVDTLLSLANLIEGNYNLEYKFTNLTEGRQIASATSTHNAAGASALIPLTLTLDPDDAIDENAAYQLDVIITGGNDIVTARAIKAALETGGDTYYMITIKTNQGGLTSPSNPAFALAGGDSPEIFFNPDPGYTVKNVKVDGVSVGALKSYMFKAVTADHTIEVEFAPLATPPQTGAASMLGLAVLSLIASAGFAFAARKKD